MLDRNAWLVNADDYSELLWTVYGRKRGEIWLVNNDLFVFNNETLFDRLYMRMLCRRPFCDTVQVVWLVLGDHAHRLLLDRRNDTNSTLWRNLNKLKEESALGRLRVSRMPSGLKKWTRTTSWTLYTVGGSVTTPDANWGAVIVRPSSFPFVEAATPAGSAAGTRIALAWIVGNNDVETTVLRERIGPLFDTLLRRDKRQSIQYTRNRYVLKTVRG